MKLLFSLILMINLVFVTDYSIEANEVDSNNLTNVDSYSSDEVFKHA